MKSDVELGRIIWNYHRLNQQVSPVDCIIGLGSYDLRVADRCVELFKQRMSDFILFSGAEGNWTRGLWNLPEAEIFKKRAVESCIDAEKIATECNSTNIGENLRFCKRMIDSTKANIKKVIIVTKPQTERRVFATIPIEWPDVEIAITSPAIDFEKQPLAHHSMSDLLNEMVGDLQRIIIYAEKGMQARQEIPQRVLDAYHLLIERGYDQHLIAIQR